MSEAETARQRFAKRLEEAGVSTVRFVDVKDGTKASLNHTQFGADSRKLGGNYGVYAGTGGDDQGGYLIDVDVDDYNDELNQDALEVANSLPETFAVESPHTKPDEPGHRYYVVDGDPRQIVREVTGDDKDNVAMSWGEIRIKNQYVVGPGSQLNAEGCDKEWCDDCAKPDGGFYRIAADRPIATISKADFRELLEADQSDTTESLEDAFDDEELVNGHVDTSGTGDAEAVADANPWILRYLAFGDEDRSDMDFAVCRELIENDVSEADAHELLNNSVHTKVYERGSDYWNRTWSNATKKATAATNGGSSALEPLESDAEDGAADADWVAKTKPYAEAIATDASPITVKDARSIAAEKVMEAYDFITPDSDGEALNKRLLWVYESIDGCYERRGTAQISADLAGRISEFSTGDHDEVANLVKRQTAVPREQLDAEQENHLLINLENGVYDVDAGEKLEHSSDYNFRHVHPFEYDPDASAEPVIDFLHEVVEHDHEVQTLLEYIGYCFEDGYPLPQFLLLHGTGGNGKGIFFDIVNALLGSRNTSSVGLNHMMGDRNFMMAELDGSFANIDGDVAGGTISTEELHVIKKLTGRDPIEVERKFEHPFTLRNRAKLMFAANKPPRFHDSTNSVARRLMAIEFPYEFVDDPGDGQKQRRPYRELMEELTSDEALSGLFNEAIDAYQKVRERGRFSIEDQGSNKERLQAYQRKADPIVAFADSCIANEQHFAIPRDVLYSLYTRYSQDVGQYPADKRIFFRKLRQATDIEVTDARPQLRTSNGKQRIRICKHLWIRSPALEFLSESAKGEIRLVMSKCHPKNAAYAEDFLGLVPDSSSSGEPEGIVADTHKLVRFLRETGGVHPDQFTDVVGEQLGMTDDRIEACLQRARNQGDILERPDGCLDAA